MTASSVCIFPHVNLLGTSRLQALEDGGRFDHSSDVLFVYICGRRQRQLSKLLCFRGCQFALFKNGVMYPLLFVEPK